MRTFVYLLAVSSLLAGAAQADDLSIMLDHPNQTAIAGQTLSFFGVIQNIDTVPGAADVFLNSDTLNFALTDASVQDNFFANVPISLAEGASSGEIDLFDITLASPESLPVGVYTGTYILLGGKDGGGDTAQDILAQVSFSVNLVPEPGSAGLLATIVILLGSCGYARSRRDSSSRV
ncbi:MAG TPA: hypothetical protein VML19_27105 [Verrucomicrobiae bacterium]|nr:hypothetical protein [Verrucomicrobiae bacterium]